MFDQMPDSFPPRRMMQGIDEIRANSARTLALLEAREQAQAGRIANAASPTRRKARLGRNEDGELAAVGASAPRSDA